MTKPNSICNPLTEGMKKGDLFTMSGRYRRRTFIEWIKNTPKELQKFRLMETYTATPGGLTRYEADQ